MSDLITLSLSIILTTLFLKKINRDSEKELYENMCNDIGREAADKIMKEIK